MGFRQGDQRGGSSRSGGSSGSGFRSGGFEQREMHKATCADCGAECNVPFKPTEGRPVYCRDCYQNHRKQ
ncbi:MAG: CxxC-x17-CxxC domain-containing protein [Nanoarchaeota archaeon]